MTEHDSRFSLLEHPHSAVKFADDNQESDSDTEVK
jgi:hypothetical protein